MPEWHILVRAIYRDPGVHGCPSAHLDDETYWALQVALLLRPTQRPLIQRGAGLRKYGGAELPMGRRLPSVVSPHATQVRWPRSYTQNHAKELPSGDTGSELRQERGVASV